MNDNDQNKQEDDQEEETVTEESINEETAQAQPVQAGTEGAAPRACAIIAARAADSKKATDIVVQEVGALTSVAEYFVIATASNNRQVDAVVEAIEEHLRKEAHLKPFHREGTDDGTWALLDYGSFIVHVFQPETREFYRLEALWNDAPVVDLEKEAGLTDLEYTARIARLVGRKAGAQE